MDHGKYYIWMWSTQQYCISNNLKAATKIKYGPVCKSTAHMSIYLTSNTPIGFASPIPRVHNYAKAFALNAWIVVYDVKDSAP